MAKKQITQEMRDQLRASFPIQAYSYLAHKPEFTTLKAMYITERLNSVFGLGRWTIEFEIVDKTETNLVIQGEFKSLDFEIIVPKQFGGASLTRKGMELADAFKGAVTDCQSKICSYLEIGIEMFKGLITVPGQKEAIAAKRGGQNSYNNKQPQQKGQKPPYQKPNYQKPNYNQGKKPQNPPKEKQLLTEDHPNFNDCVQYLADSDKTHDIKKLKVRYNISEKLEKILHERAADLAFFYWQQEQEQKALAEFERRTAI